MDARKRIAVLLRMAKDVLSPSEALFGFGGWLTTRDEPVTMSAKHDAAVVAELIDEFCKVNGLEEPRQHWERNLTHPPESRAASEGAPGPERIRVALELLRIAMSVAEAWKLFGLRPGQEGKVKKRYYELARKYHPDKPGGSTDAMRILNEAKEVIDTGEPSGPKRRRGPTRRERTRYEPTEEEREEFRRQQEERKRKEEESKAAMKADVAAFQAKLKSKGAAYRNHISKFAGGAGSLTFDSNVSDGGWTLNGSMTIENGEVSFQVGRYMYSEGYHYESNVYANRKAIRIQRSRFNRTDSLDDFLDPDFLFPPKRMKRVFQRAGEKKGMQRKDFEAALKKELGAELRSDDMAWIPLGGERRLLIYRMVFMRTPGWMVNGIYEKHRRVSRGGKVKTWPETEEGLMDIHRYVRDVKSGRISSRIDAGRITTPRYRLEPFLVFGGRFGMSNLRWDKRSGRPTAKNIKRYVDGFNASLEADGVNSHLGRGSALYGGRIVDQRTDEIVAEWEDKGIIRFYKSKPTFEVVSSERVAGELVRIAKLLDGAVIGDELPLVQMAKVLSVKGKVEKFNSALKKFQDVMDETIDAIGGIADNKASLRAFPEFADMLKLRSFVTRNRMRLPSDDIRDRLTRVVCEDTGLC